MKYFGFRISDFGFTGRSIPAVFTEWVSEKFEIRNSKFEIWIG